MSVGLEITIRKSDETDDYAEYQYFGGGADEAGLVRLVKSTGDVNLLKLAAGETPDQPIFSRVANRLVRHWIAGELPDLTWWAS